MPEQVATPTLNAILIGALVPLVGYAFNKFQAYNGLPEWLKAFVQVVAIAVATGIYTAADQGNLGWNRTTEGNIVAAVLSALYAHNYLWKPGGVNTALGARQS
jgi:putative effector of murein hydrolase